MMNNELITERKGILLDLIEKGEITKLGEFTNEHGELYFVIRGANTLEYPNCVALVGDSTNWEPIMTLEGFNITEEEHKKMLEIVSKEEWSEGKLWPEGNTLTTTNVHKFIQAAKEAFQ